MEKKKRVQFCKELSMKKSLMVKYSDFKLQLDAFVREVKNPVDVITEVTKILINLLSLERKYFDTVTDKAYKARVVANLKELRGIISSGTLPTHTLTNEDKSREVKLIIPKSELNVEGLDQCEYLLSRCLFLMSLYGKYCWYPVSAVEGLPDNAVLDLLSRELWIAINALRLRQTYNEINNALKPVESEEDKKQKKLLKKELKKRIGDFIDEIISEYNGVFNDLDVGDEVILPVGTQHHAMYLAFVKLKDNNVLMRLDDLGLISKKYAQPNEKIGSSNIPPYVVDIIPISILQSKRDYLTQMCMIKLLNDETEYSIEFELPKLYLRGQQSSLDLQVIGYPEYEELTMGNCVIKNYSVGTRIRNHDVLKTGDAFCRWLNEQEIQYLSETLFSGCTKARDNRLMGFVKVEGKIISIKHQTIAKAIGTDIVGVDINNIDIVLKLMQSIPEIPDKIIKAVQADLAAGRKDASIARAEAYERGANFHQITESTYSGLRIDLTKPVAQSEQKENNKYAFFQPDSPRTRQQKEHQKAEETKALPALESTAIKK